MELLKPFNQVFDTESVEKIMKQTVNGGRSKSEYRALPGNLAKIQVANSVKLIEKQMGSRVVSLSNDGAIIKRP